MLQNESIPGEINANTAENGLKFSPEAEILATFCPLWPTVTLSLLKVASMKPTQPMLERVLLGVFSRSLPRFFRPLLFPRSPKPGCV